MKSFVARLAITALGLWAADAVVDGFRIDGASNVVIAALLLGIVNALVPPIDVLLTLQISEGILNSSLVHPREVFKSAILESAASIVLLHNHPSGEAEPSQEDKTITRRLMEAGKFLDIPVLDHIIIGHHKYFSFREAGLIGE